LLPLLCRWYTQDSKGKAMDILDKHRDTVKSLEQYKRRLQAKLEQVSKDLEAVDRVIRGMQDIEGDASAQGDTDTTSGGYAELPPQTAVRKFFRENPDRSFKPSVLAKKLRSLGYVPTTTDSNVFVTQIRTACIRLAEKGRLRQTTIDGKVAFRLDGQRAMEGSSEGTGEVRDGENKP